MNDAALPAQPHAARKHWMAVLARAEAGELARLLEAQGGAPRYRKLRGPEAGLVMVRGRVGGGGGPFNLGEMTVTRCSVRTESGQIGHAYVAGRDSRQAELAAVLDAMLQDPAQGARLQARIIEPLADAQRALREQVAAKAAATRVQFFAMQNMRTTT